MSNRNALLQRLGLATVLALGFGLVWGMVVGWGEAIIEGSGDRERVYEQVQVRLDGTPLIRRDTYSGSQRATFFTLDRKEVQVPRNLFLLPEARLAPDRRGWEFFGSAAGPHVLSFSDQREPPTFWYFVYEGRSVGSGYFAGFDSRSKLPVGYLGRRGFRADVPPAEERLPVDNRQLAAGRVFSRATGPTPSYFASSDDDAFEGCSVAMISDTQLLAIDFRSGTVTVLMESPELVSVSSFGMLPPPGNWGSEAVAQAHLVQFLVVRTPDQFLVLDASGKQLRSYAIPEELRNRTCRLCEPREGTALLIWTRRLPDRSSREELWWIDRAGKVTRQTEVALARDAQPPHVAADTWKAASIVPVPIGMTFLATVIAPIGDLETGAAPDYASALAYNASLKWPAVATVWVLGAALAWLCSRRQRRYVLGGTWLWMVFVLLAGVPGMLAYLFHRRWAPLESCPACQHLVPHDRAACAACNVEFPPAKPLGIEVFA